MSYIEKKTRALKYLKSSVLSLRQEPNINKHERATRKKINEKKQTRGWNEKNLHFDIALDL